MAAKKPLMRNGEPAFAGGRMPIMIEDEEALAKELLCMDVAHAAFGKPLSQCDRPECVVRHVMSS